jgi:Leucine-rich repeat (LRR) protein
MKRKLKAIAAVLLVLVMLGSAMPMQPAAEAMTPPTTRYATPHGYNDHDYQKMVAFFEQTDENGVRNGEKLSEDYDPTDPETWWEYDGDYCRGRITWTTVAGEYRLCEIFFGGIGNDALPLELVGFLDVSGCTALKDVRCNSWGDIQLTGLDVSGCAALVVLYCDGNELTELDVSGCAALGALDCDYNQLTELDVSANTELWRLCCSGNQLTELDVSENTELYTLRCYGNQLTELDVSENTWLYELDCFGNELVRIDISGCIDLDGLDCSENQLTELDLSGNTSLRWLDCSGNRITELDLTANSELEALRCSENQLTAIDVSANTSLTELNCSGNQLTELDLSENTSVYCLECEDNYITFLDLTNNCIDIDTVSAEGPGFIGVKTVIPGEYLVPAISAVPAPGSTFCGWYATDGTLISTEAELVIDREECYYPYDYIARFTASTPGGIGDVDGDGVVRVSDAVLIMRCALGLIEFTPEQILCGDVDGDGVIKIADAVMVIRIALGLV